MYIHIGNNIIVSDNNLVGIFNIDTLQGSRENDWIIGSVNNNDKTIAIMINNKIESSNVSPFTIIKRTSLGEEYVWRRTNDKKL